MRVSSVLSVLDSYVGDPGIEPCIIVWPLVSGVSVDPTSQVHLSAMLVLPIVGN
jgi:hypothetical protein